jgi:hypothetical protein
VRLTDYPTDWPTVRQMEMLTATARPKDSPKDFQTGWPKAITMETTRLPTEKGLSMEILTVMH